MCARNRPKYITYWVYLLLCRDETIYTGITTDVARRLAEHKAGSGAAYTRAHGAKKMIYTEKHEGRSNAQKREAEIKRYARKEKLTLAKNWRRDIQ